jgi:hypothetical protein
MLKSGKALKLTASIGIAVLLIGMGGIVTVSAGVWTDSFDTDVGVDWALSENMSHTVGRIQLAVTEAIEDFNGYVDGALNAREVGQAILAFKFKAM